MNSQLINNNKFFFYHSLKLFYVTCRRKKKLSQEKVKIKKYELKAQRTSTSSNSNVKSLFKQVYEKEYINKIK